MACAVAEGSVLNYVEGGHDRTRRRRSTRAKRELRDAAVVSLCTRVSSKGAEDCPCAAMSTSYVAEEAVNQTPEVSALGSSKATLAALVC